MNGYAAHSAETELAQLKELCARQAAAREEVHRAVSSQDLTRLQRALQEAEGLLLAVEEEWGQRELAKLARGQAKQDEEDALVIPSAEQLLAEDEERQRREEAEAVAEEQRRASEAEAAWKKVQEAIDADDERALLKALNDVEGSLPPEKVAVARRRIPAMRARAEMRKELSIAIKQPENTLNLKYVIAAAKRSCLPQAEVLEAEAILKAAEAEQRRAKAEKAAPKAVAVEQVALGGDAQPSKSEIKAPETKLELAVLSKDKELIQEALAELKANGMSNQDRNYLYACARANFWGR